jgi:hypothetical protein
MRKKKFHTLFGYFFTNLGPKTHFRIGRHKSEDLIIRLPIQIQLLDNEIQKSPKSPPPTVYYGEPIFLGGRVWILISINLTWIGNDF